MSETIRKIYDLILKRVLELSPRAVVGFINGLYDESMPVNNSEVIYTATESISDDLGYTFSDKMLTIRSGDILRRFHIEAEITSNDDEIALRIFDYGYKDVLRNKKIKDGLIALSFPQPKIIYLEHWSTAPDEVTLELDFWGQGTSKYTVPTMKFLDYSIEELEKRNMVILLPLYLLKLRRKIETAKEKGAAGQYTDELKALLKNDILETLTKSVNAGKITHRDTHTLLSLLGRLYNHLYGEIKEFQDEKVKDMIDEKLLLETDVLVAETMESAAKGMLLEGMDVAAIERATKLPRERILKIRESMAVVSA